MNKTLNFLKSIGEIFIILLIYLLIITIFNYFNILSTNITNIINYIIIILMYFYLGFKSAKRNKEKGYLSGLISGTFISLIFILFSLINNDFNLSSLIYYATLIVSSVIGGIIGVPKEK